jgi:CheY-like chemotaxis protein
MRHSVQDGRGLRRDRFPARYVWGMAPVLPSGYHARRHPVCFTKGMDSNSETNPESPVGRSVPSQLVSDATSEINNLLQIITGTCSDVEEMFEGNRGAEKCFKTLRECVGRAGAIAATLAGHAGATDHKMLINPQLTALLELQPVTPVAAKPTILVVDDETQALALMKQILVGAGYRVTTAESGADCLYLFRRRPSVYQLVILDLTMPSMDGEETFHRLREIRPDVPVVLCTGFIQADRLERLMKAGLSGFFRKPLTPDEIISHVHSVLESVKFAQAEATKKLVKNDPEPAQAPPAPAVNLEKLKKLKQMAAECDQKVAHFDQATNF